GQRILVDSQYEAFLMSFLKKSVLQFDRSIDQDFRSLAIAKHHVKELIMKRINETLAICQRHSVYNENEMRGKFEKLIEKLIKQRISKREKNKNTKKSENADGVIWWLNKKASNYNQQKNCENINLNSEVTASSTSSNLIPADKIPKSVSFPLPEQLSQEQVASIKESPSDQIQVTFTNSSQEKKGTSVDVASKDKSTSVEGIISEIASSPRETGDECLVKKSVKHLSRPSSVDGTRLAPTPKKVKTGPNPTRIDFGGVHEQAASFPDS
ncbi:7294_t:CDS:2, partial [Acaulospora morrowiae]